MSLLLPPQGIICKVTVLTQQPLSQVDMLCALLELIPHSHAILYVASSPPFPIGKGIVKRQQGLAVYISVCITMNGWDILPVVYG